MKKITLFIMSIFAMGITLAQNVDDWSYVPVTADNNMSVAFPLGTLSDYGGYELKAYAVKYIYAGPADAILGIPPIDSLIVPTSNTSLIPEDGSSAIPIMGSDGLCGCDQAIAGDLIRFFISTPEGYVTMDLVPQVIYAANALFSDFSSVSFWIGDEEVLFGCTDSAYVEYNPLANISDGSCATLIVSGCMDATACSYDSTANVEDNSCTYLDGICDTCVDGIVVDKDADNDGICDGDEIEGCTDNAACNYDADTTTDTDNTLCIFSSDLDACATCSGETDGSGTIVDNDADNDFVCNDDEIGGCTDETAYNYNVLATDDDGTCYPVIFGCINPAADNYEHIGDVMVDANTDETPTLCEYSGINGFGSNGGSEESPSYITSNSMSVLFPVENLGVWDGSDMTDGAVIFAVYETARLNNEWVGFSEVSGIQCAGAVTWTGAQAGMPVFGSDNNQDNGFQEFEDLVWLVEAADGTIYNASLTYATAGFDGAYEDGEFVVVSSVTIGAPFYDGCMDATAPNFKPLATTDDGSCAAAYSIGCMDISAVNFAGADANPTHDNAENFGDAFVQNHGVNLNTGTTFSSNTAANIHDQSYCQTQIEGCTDAMAINYDAQATQNDKTICDWTLNGMQEYNVDGNGLILDIDYNFGAVDPANENDGIVGSDFGNANVLFDAGALDVTAHVVDNLANVMQWIDMDEERDAYELSDTINDMQDRYDANDILWLTTYTDTLAAVEAWFGVDEYADSLELSDTVTSMQARYDTNDLMWLTTYTDTLADVTAWFAADEAADAAHLDSTEVADDALLALTISDMQAVYDANEAMWLTYTAATLVSSDSLLSVTNDSLVYHRAALVIDLHSQWNTIAYYLHHESPVVAQFENQFGSETAIAENINIVKNNEGLFYWPEFNFDGIVMLVPGQGYQVRVKDSSNGKSDFIFDHSINADAYRTLVPTVPAWAIEMDVQNHPNDIRTLVRVVNMLGQEVNPANQFNGEVLLYLYNDGTVEKKIVE